MRVGNSVFRTSRLSTAGLRRVILVCTALLLSVSFSESASAQFFDDGYSNYKVRRAAARRRQAERRRVARRQGSSSRRISKKKIAKSWNIDPSNEGPVQIVISIPEQRGYVYQGGKLVTSTRVSTGKRGHATPKGVFSILQKNRRHYSNLYNSAPMPYMQRITWSGVALHEGHVPNYPASHGCIRLPRGFAKKLFSFTKQGAHVIVTHDNVVPTSITHANLMQPAVSISESMPKDAEITGSLEDKKEIKIPGHVRRLKGRERIRASQRLLAYLGYKPGRADGDRGRDTVNAIRKFQSDFLLPVTNKVTDEFFMFLYRHVNREDVAMGRDKNNPAHAASLAKPIRILVTRRTIREKSRDAQRLLAFLGYYKGEADGYIGRDTIKAIKRFQDEFFMKISGTVSDELLSALYKQANEGEVAMGHIYVRQDFREVFDMPMTIKDPNKPLGTHLFTAQHFEKGATKVEWQAQSLKERAAKSKSAGKSSIRKKGKRKSKEVASIPATVISASEALDRIVIPEEARKRISEMLTSGSSIVITDNGLGRETGRGTDFVVLTR